MKKVGAIAVRCGCVFCSACLVLKEVLYFAGSEISADKAAKSGVKCVSCGSKLAERKRRQKTNET
jgi:hypothetical protein